MKVGVTGATGLVGHAIATHLVREGHEVTALGRGPLPDIEFRHFDLTGELPDLTGFDALVHAAFAHVPGRYRGGEGDDPEGFLRINRDATLRLFKQAQGCGVGRIVFLSSRAVYDGYPAGTDLREDMPVRPTSLYGQIKADVEAELSKMQGIAVASLRATGVYSASTSGQTHKWAELFEACANGEEIAPRIGTEVHTDDVAMAVEILLTVEAAALAPVTFNASDIMLDRHDLLALYAALTGTQGILPPPSDSASVSVMDCTRLRYLGWRPRGMAGLRDCLRRIPAT